MKRLTQMPGLLAGLILLFVRPTAAQSPGKQGISEYDEVFVSPGASILPKGLPSYGGGFGVGPGEHWMVEFQISRSEFGDSAIGLGHFATGDSEYPISQSHVVDLLTSAVYEFRDRSQSMLTPFLRGGVGGAFSSITTPAFHCCTFPAPPGNVITTWKAWDVSGGVGVRIPIGLGLGIRPELRYSWIFSAFTGAIGNVPGDHWIRAVVDIYYVHKAKGSPRP